MINRNGTIKMIKTGKYRNTTTTKKNEVFLKSIEYLLFAALIIFNVNNFIQYSPFWGFDGQAHTLIVDYVSKHWQFPKEAIYGVSNPPLYYFVAAFIYRLTGAHTFKYVQFLSLLLYVVNLVMLFACLKKFKTNNWLQILLVFFFALLPTHMHFAYMIFNYSLSIFFTLLLFYFMFYFYDKGEISTRTYITIGLCVVMGILTSLTGVANFMLSILYFVFFPSISLKKKLVGIIIFMLVTLILVFPYYQYKSKRFGGFLKVPHRGESTIKLSKFYKIYPWKFYFNFSIEAFETPCINEEFGKYVDQRLNWGVWTMLHQTLYGDYFNYQVDKMSCVGIKDTTNLIYTKPHFISLKKVNLIRILNYLGIPISLIFLYVFIFWSINSIIFLVSRQTNLFPDTISFIATILIFLQFFIYILKYPNFVNISAGYVFPAIFLFIVGIGRLIRYKIAVFLITLFLFLYSIVSYYTFWKM